MGTFRRVSKAKCPKCGGQIERYYISDCTYNDASGSNCKKCGKEYSETALNYLEARVRNEQKAKRKNKRKNK